MRFYIKEGILLADDDFVVRDDAKNEVYRVESDLIQIVKEFVIREHNTGEEVARIKRRLFEKTRTYIISQQGHEVATIHKNLDQQFDSSVQFEIVSANGMVFHVRGNFKEWDLEILDHYGYLLGHITKVFAIFGDHYALDIAPNVDPPFMIAIAIVLDEFRETM